MWLSVPLLAGGAGAGAGAGVGAAGQGPPYRAVGLTAAADGGGGGGGAPLRLKPFGCCRCGESGGSEGGPAAHTDTDTSVRHSGTDTDTADRHSGTDTDTSVRHGGTDTDTVCATIQLLQPQIQLSSYSPCIRY